MSNNLGVIPVSVVIPCYRSSATIRRAVNSVVKQVVRPAEIILIDDASNDNSLVLLLQLKEEHPQENIIVDFLESNGGPGIARNRGWELSSQPWLAFLDADDTWHPRKLEICWAWILDHPETTLLGHQTQQIKDGTESDHVLLPDRINGISISFLQMLVANRFYTRSVMVKRNLPFRFMSRAYTEDYLLWLEIILSREPSYVLNQPLAFSYRPEFSHGGYSGHLWTHEKRELRSWRYLFTSHKVSFFTLVIALCWSYTKYVRRVLRGFLA